MTDRSVWSSLCFGRPADTHVSIQDRAPQFRFAKSNKFKRVHQINLAGKNMEILQISQRGYTFIQTVLPATIWMDGVKNCGPDNRYLCTSLVHDYATSFFHSIVSHSFRSSLARKQLAWGFVSFAVCRPTCRGTHLYAIKNCGKKLPLNRADAARWERLRLRFAMRGPVFLAVAVRLNHLPRFTVPRRTLCTVTVGFRTSLCWNHLTSLTNGLGM